MTQFLMIFRHIGMENRNARFKVTLCDSRVVFAAISQASNSVGFSQPVHFTTAVTFRGMRMKPTTFRVKRKQPCFWLNS